MCNTDQKVDMLRPCSLAGSAAGQLWCGFWIKWQAGVLSLTPVWSGGWWRVEVQGVGIGGRVPQFMLMFIWYVNGSLIKLACIRDGLAVQHRNPAMDATSDVPSWWGFSRSCSCLAWQHPEIFVSLTLAAAVPALAIKQHLRQTDPAPVSSPFSRRQKSAEE